MNRFVGSGMLTHPGKVFGAKRKVLRFTLSTFVCRTKKDETPVWWSVPCVVFSPSRGLVSLVTDQFRLKHINLEGKINTSQFESRGQTRLSTDVIVEERNIEVYDATKRLAMGSAAGHSEEKQNTQAIGGTTETLTQEKSNELHDGADSVAAA